MREPFSRQVSVIAQNPDDEFFVNRFTHAFLASVRDPEASRQLIEITALDPATDDLDIALCEFIADRSANSPDEPFEWPSEFGRNWRAHILASKSYLKRGFKRRADIHQNLGVILRAIESEDELLDVRDQLRQIHRPEHDTDWVAFVVPTGKEIRPLKIASSLRKAGKRVKLFTRSASLLEHEHAKYFDAIYPYDNVQDLWAAYDGFPAVAVHCFLPTGEHCEDALAAFAMDPTRFVIDIKDLQDSQTSPATRLKHLPKFYDAVLFGTRVQRFLLNHSQWVCARVGYKSIQRSYLTGARQSRIYLPEMAWGHPSPTHKLSDDDGKLHVVHGGSFLTEKAAGAQYASLLWLAERAEEFDIHFHLYAQPWIDQDMDDYVALAERSPNFHNHAALPYFDWLEEIKRYDVGMFYIHPEDESELAKMPRMIDPSGAWANKLGDFVDGDLYTVVSRKYRYMTGIVQHYGVGEGVTLDQVLQKSYWDDLKARVLNRRIDFSRGKAGLDIHAHGSRLCRFYQNVSGRSVEKR